MKASASSSLCSEKLKVLADATRLAVVQLLLEGPRHVGDLQAKIRIEQSLLSHHLSVLRRARLVVAIRDGKGFRYEIAPDVARAASGSALNLGCCQISFWKGT